MSGDWFHGGRPGEVLKFDAGYSQDKGRSEHKARFFENQIRQFLLDNRHRVRFLPWNPIRPWLSKRWSAYRTELDGIQKRLSIEEIEAITSGTRLHWKSCRKKQKTITCLPTLDIEDIPPINS